MVLIPLRFVEVGQMTGGDEQVLGETTVSQEVSQPEVVPTAVLEEPYKTIDNGVGCVNQVDIDSAFAELKAGVASNKVSQEQAVELMANLVAVSQKVCK